jgi:hypothetical protein
MAKRRYIADGKIFFVKVTVVLKDGRELSSITDTTISDIDLNWNIFKSKAVFKHGGNIDSFQVVGLSRYDPEVKKYMKEQGIHLPGVEAEEKLDSFGELRLEEETVKALDKLKRKAKQQPGKYRG